MLLFIVISILDHEAKNFLGVVTLWSRMRTWINVCKLGSNLLMERLQAAGYHLPIKLVDLYKLLRFSLPQLHMEVVCCVSRSCIQ